MYVSVCIIEIRKTCSPHVAWSPPNDVNTKYPYNVAFFSQFTLFGIRPRVRGTADPDASKEVRVILDLTLNYSNKVSQQEAAEPQCLVYCSLKTTSCYPFIDLSAGGSHLPCKTYRRILISRYRLFSPLLHLQFRLTTSWIQGVSHNVHLS